MIIAKKLMLHVCFFMWDGVLVIYNCRKNRQPICLEHLNLRQTSEKVPGTPRHSSVSFPLTDRVSSV